MGYRKGDHICVARFAGAYYHHGIYVGSRRVIHVEGEPLNAIVSPNKIKIRRVSLDEFAAGGDVQVVRHASQRNSSDVVSRASSYVGRLVRHPKNHEKTGYNLLLRNCEHFATWCRTGDWRSQQVEMWLQMGIPLVLRGFTSKTDIKKARRQRSRSKSTNQRNRGKSRRRRRSRRPKLGHECVALPCAQCGEDHCPDCGCDGPTFPAHRTRSGHQCVATLCLTCGVDHCLECGCPA